MTLNGPTIHPTTNETAIATYSWGLPPNGLPPNGHQKRLLAQEARLLKKHLAAIEARRFLHRRTNGHISSGSASQSFPSLKDREGREMNPRLRDSDRFVSLPRPSLGKDNESDSPTPGPSAQNGGSNETAAFRPWTAVDILRRGTQPRDPSWLCDSLIPLGRLVLLSAYAKVGKTELAYQLALDVARGEPFLGYATRKGGRAVLILAVEEHPEDIRHRLLKLGLKLTDKVHVYPKRLDPPIEML